MPLSEPEVTLSKHGHLHPQNFQAIFTVCLAMLVAFLASASAQDINMQQQQQMSIGGSH